MVSWGAAPLAGAQGHPDNIDDTFCIYNMKQII